MIEFLRNRGFNAVTITESQVDSILNTLSEGDVLWIHGKVSDGMQDSVIKEMEDFYANGGKIILSLEAVRLLNLAGIEPQIFETVTKEIKDEGYGRMLGFSCFYISPHLLWTQRRRLCT